MSPGGGGVGVFEVKNTKKSEKDKGGVTEL